MSNFWGMGEILEKLGIALNQEEFDKVQNYCITVTQGWIIPFSSWDWFDLKSYGKGAVSPKKSLLCLNLGAIQQFLMESNVAQFGLDTKGNISDESIIESLLIGEFWLLSSSFNEW